MCVPDIVAPPFVKVPSNSQVEAAPGAVSLNSIDSAFVKHGHVITDRGYRDAIHRVAPSLAGGKRVGHGCLRSLDDAPWVDAYNGKPNSTHGPRVLAGQTVACTKRGKSVQFVVKIGDKTQTTIDWSISADGKQLTSTQHDAGVPEPSVGVYDRVTK